MRIIASLQAKRGSSRGLVHYIARSKIEPTREPVAGRELFNEFSNDLSVESSNNSLKIGLSKERVRNDNLHHLVISFRDADYRALGTDKETRQAALRDITRAGIDALKAHLNAEKLFWVGAVHLNTANPHVHLAIQKQYFSKWLDMCYLTKMPREMLPHYELVNNERVFNQGRLVLATEQKMDAITAQERANERSLKHPQIDGGAHSFPVSESESEKTSRDLSERSILGKAIIAEMSLRQIDGQIDHLIEHGDKMRFLVTDSQSGVKRRLSLRDLDQRGGNDRLSSIKFDYQKLSDRSSLLKHGGVSSEPESSEKRIIKTILLKMLAKYESQKATVEQEAGSSILEAKKIREQCRKGGLKLPIPTLSKSDIDRIQAQCLETSNIRQFTYLEGVRFELENSGEIDGRSQKDFNRILGQKTLASLRFQNAERKLTEFDARRFYQLIDLDGQSTSLAHLEKNSEMKHTFGSKVLENLRGIVNRLARNDEPIPHPEDTQLRESIEQKLGMERLVPAKEQAIAKKQSVLLEKILKSQQSAQVGNGTYLPSELEEIEKLALRLNLREVYEQNWLEQRALIESASADCPAARRLAKAGHDSEFGKHKLEVIGGRAIGRETIAKIHLEKAKEELETFKKTKQYHKFPVTNLRNQKTDYLSLRDVDWSSKHSLLDQAVDLITEGKEHRRTRKVVTEMVKEKERRLKKEYQGAKEILATASVLASEFKKSTFLSLRSEPAFAPVFTPAEISLIEFRINHTQNSKEAAMFSSLLASFDSKSARSISKLLGDFGDTGRVSTDIKDLDIHEREVIKGQAINSKPSNQTQLAEQTFSPSEIKRPLPERLQGLPR